MIRRAAAPPFLLGAPTGCCGVMVAEALGAHDYSRALLVLPVVAVLAGRASAWPVGAVAIALVLAGIAAARVITFENDSLVPAILLPLTLYLAGLALRGRETLAGRLARQADELELERDAYARLSVRYERARIAAEQPDVVTHAISVMVVQAGAFQRLPVREPARAVETFGVIATAARQAQADLDRLADLLAQDAAPERDADLGFVRQIVDTARASGLPVALRVSGDTSDVSGAVDHAALRAVQERLTNALRYAPGAAIEVSVDSRPGALALSVVNGRPTAPSRLACGSGRGLTGLRERVGVCGGTMPAGPDGDGGWSVRARLAGRARSTIR